MQFLTYFEQTTWKISKRCMQQLSGTTEVYNFMYPPCHFLIPYKTKVPTFIYCQNVCWDAEKVREQEAK